jgi:hypothetical protein
MDAPCRDGSKTHQAYMWVIAGGLSSNPAYRIYDFATNRRHINAATMLRHYSGVLHSDKYGAYEALAKRETITWAPCWAHIRRKFIEAETGDPPFRDWVLKKSGDLFKLEEVVWMLPEHERIHKRQKEAIPIIDELTTAIQQRLTDGNILPKSKFREALTYFCGLIPYLKNYTKFAWARLDNNVAERAVRPLAIGRKNWLFVGNEQGGETAGIVLSLVQSCRACGVNPREYLEDVMRRMMSHNASKLYELLPDQWAAARTFQKYLDCGNPAKGFACAHCSSCNKEFFIAFSCRGRGLCPSCNTRSMVFTAAHLVENVIPCIPIRQWVISFPQRIRHYLLEYDILQDVLNLVVDEIRKTIIACSPDAPNAQSGL